MIPELQFVMPHELNSEDFVRQHLTPERTEMIYECITSAIQEYRTKYADLRIKHSARTESSIIHDLIISNIKGRFSNDSDTYFVTRQNLSVLGINNGAVIVRFKKMDRKLRVHNVPTRQSNMFNNQLAFFGPSIKINAGYFPNGLNIEVFIACPENNQKNYWAWPIKPAVKTIIPEIHTEQLPQRSRRPVPKRKEGENYASRE